MLRFTSDLRDRITGHLAGFDPVRLDAPGRKQASVALTIAPHQDDPDLASLLLTKRVSKLNRHAGQWALPGGRVDEGETSLGGALREMQEEINLSLTGDALLGRLDDYETQSGYLISPYVFWAEDISAMTPSPDEVAFIHHIPLTDFDHDNLVELVPLDNKPHPLLRVHLGEIRIHAPTAAFLLQFWDRAVHGKEHKVQHYSQPDWAR